MIQMGLVQSPAQWVISIIKMLENPLQTGSYAVCEAQLLLFLCALCIFH